MRPIRLVAQAFGPFAERIDIDFRPALDQRLFGIYGPTGAGKTSLLDAMAFALFGESSGGERTRGHLRSDLADLETRTFVEFVFELGAKRYFVRREPEQELKSPRKDSRSYPATAAVFDATGLPPETLSLETPGRPLAERKLKEVDDVLCALLGYDAEQFRQVVMLPQGRFRALLTAGSDERSKILRGLFDVRIFERFAERLKAQAAGLEADFQAARREILTRLEDLGVDSAEALAQQIAERNAAQLETQAKRQALEAARTQAEAALAAGRVLAARFAEAATARVALADLQSRDKEVERLRQRLAQAEAARDLAPLAVAAQRAAGEAAELQAAVAALEAEMAAAQAQAKAAQAALDASLAQAGERKRLRDERERAAQRVERVAAAEPLHAAMAGAEAAVATALTEHGRAVQDADQARQTAAQAEQNLAVARQNAGALASLELSLERLGQAKAAADAFEAQQALAAARAAALLQAEAAATEASAAAAAAADHLAALRARLDTVHAVQLAAALEDGRPCPVCGSLAHPQPAVGEAADADLTARLKAAQDEADSTQTALVRARTKAAEAQALAADAGDRLAGLARPERPSTALVPEIAAAQAEHARLTQAPSIAAAETARSEAVETLTASELVLQAADAALTNARTRLEGHRAALATELATVPEALRQPEAAQTALDAAAKAEAEAQAAHEAAESCAAVAQQDLAVRAATLSGRRDAQARASAAADAAGAELAAAAAPRGLAGEAYGSALADIPQIEAISAEVRLYEQGLAAALDRTTRAEQGLEALAPPDLAQLDEVKAQAEARLEEQLARSAADEAELRTWVQGQGRIEAAERRRQAAEAAYATVGELSRLAQGKNAVRMSLVDYAVAAYFEEVLAAANIRFGRMSGGRFELRRKTGGQDARSRAGLEILVYDGHSGRERDAKTLSGGEGFMAALALALGLSDVVQAESGGVKLDAIFIDEGFGHLDEQSLDRALDTLRELVGQARAVGIISHVDAVKAQIPVGFEVTPQLRGSRVEPRSN